MFTMKKLASLAIVGFMASSMMVACSDDEGDEESDAVKLPSSWTKSGSVTLGNGTKGTAGSFLDADSYPLSAIKKADAAGKKAVIDFVLTGSKFITPNGCESVDFCKTELAGGNEDAVFIKISTSSLSATSSPEDIQKAVQDQDITENDLANEVSVSKDGKYLLFTDKGLAYIIVNGDVGNEGTLSVGWIDDSDFE